MEYLFCFICYLYTLLTIIDTTNINTTIVHVISSTCKVYNGNSDCSKYDLQICHTRNFCPRKWPFNQQGCFRYVNYMDLKADKGSMQHFQPPNEKIRDMSGFFIAVMNRRPDEQPSDEFVATSCEQQNSRTNTINGIKITTTNVQDGQPSYYTFNFTLTIEMDCAISSCYGQECEICVSTEQTTAYTSADTLQTNITVSNDQTTHYTQKVETDNSVSTQQVKTSKIVTTQGVTTSNILTTQGVTTSNILTTQGVTTSNILTTQPVKTSNILTTQRVSTGNEASTPLTTSTEHTENSSNGNLTVEGRPQVETNTGQIIGIVLGVCGGIILVVIVLYFICYHKKTKKTAVEDVPEIHVENIAALKTNEQVERNDEKMNLLNGSAPNNNEYPPGTSTVFGPDSQEPIKDDDILNSPKQVSEVQENSTEKYINPGYPQIDCERDGKRKKKQKKYKRSKKKGGSKRDKTISTEFINENERNVSNYTEPEIDGRSKTVCYSDEEIDKTMEKQNDNDYKKQNIQAEDAENNEEPNTETRSVPPIPDCPSSPEVTQISRIGSPVPNTDPNVGDTHCTKSMQSLDLEDYTENDTSNSMTTCNTNTTTDIGGTTNNHEDDDTQSPPLQDVKFVWGEEMSNLERQNVKGVPNLEQQHQKAGVSNLEERNVEGVPNSEHQNVDAVVSNLERQNPETEAPNLEQQNASTREPNLEQQNAEPIVFNLEQQHSGTERSSLERQNVEAEMWMWNSERRQNVDAGTLELDHPVSLPEVLTLDISRPLPLHGHYTTEESDHGGRIKSKKKKKHKHKHKRRYHIDKVDISTVHDVDAYETHIKGLIDVKITTSPKKKQYTYDYV